MAAESTVAGFIVPGLLVVELQRVPYADPLSSLGTRVSDIVSTAARNLKGADMGDVRLMAAYVMDRRAPGEPSSHGASKGHANDLSLRNGSDNNNNSSSSKNGDNGCNDICTLLCVASSSVGGSSHWVGLDMQCSRESACPRGRRPRRGRKWFSISVAPASLIGCFTRHASINASGSIDRKETDAAGCATCARTWSGFALAIARTQSRERVNAARLAALTAASLQARRSFRCEAGIVDVLCAGVVAIKEVAPLMHPCDPRLQRAERALSALAGYVEGALMLCLWAERFDATEAKRIIGDADARAALALPEAAPRLRRAADVLDSVVGVAVAAGVIIARANVTAAEAVCAAAGFNGSPVTFTHMRDALSGLSLTAVLDQSEADMADWARRASACFMSARKITIDAAAKATAAAAAQTAGASSSNARESALPSWKERGRCEARDCLAQERDPVSTASNMPATVPDTAATTLTCASGGCRTEGRRIVSGCVVTVDCDARCSVSFHRSCWEAAHIALHASGADDAGVPCATSDCTGWIVRVTSARLRAMDRTQRVLWQSPEGRHRRSPQREPATAPPTSPPDEDKEQEGSTDTVVHNRPRGQHRHDRSPHAQHRRRQSIDDLKDEHEPPARVCADSDCGGDVLDDVPGDGTQEDDTQAQMSKTATYGGRRLSPDGSDPTTAGSVSAPSEATAVPDAPMPMANVTAYQKQRQSRERLPLKRKRPRDRTGRRQRCHVAAQQRHRLLVMAGLAEPPADEIVDAKSPDDVAPTEPVPDDALASVAAAAAADDALWPCFFVPDRV